MNRYIGYSISGTIIVTLLGIGVFLTRPIATPDGIPGTPDAIVMPELTPEDEQFALDMAKSAQEALRRKEARLAGVTLLASALKKQNIEICNEITLPEIQTDCREKVTFGLASSRGDASLCESLSGGLMTECKDTVLYATTLRSNLADQATSSCDAISDTSLKALCIRELESVLLQKKQTQNGMLSKEDCTIFKDTEVKTECTTRLSAQNDYLLLSQASKENNPKLCQDISNPELQNKCTNSTIFIQARKTNTIALCKNITDERLSGQCEKEIALLQERTLFEQALRSNDSTLCEKLVDEKFERSCLDRTRIKNIIESGDPKGCDIITDTGLRASCTKSIELTSAS